MIKTKSGFTIVELLIVIVIIGILAAITIAIYSGIQNRAYDASVQSDLATIAKKMELYKVDNSDKYPVGANFNSFAATAPLQVSKSAYQSTTNSFNLLNCTVNSGAGYAVLAVAKSGSKFWISSTGGGVAKDTSATDFGETTACPVMLSGSYSNGAGWASTGGWRW